MNGSQYEDKYKNIYWKVLFLQLLNRRFGGSSLLFQDSKDQWRKHVIIFILCLLFQCSLVLKKEIHASYIDLLNPEEGRKTLRNVGSNVVKRKLPINQYSFIWNHLFIYPWTTLHSIKLLNIKIIKLEMYTTLTANIWEIGGFHCLVSDK